MIKKFKKLMILINNCDKIIEMLEKNNESKKPTESSKKSYSVALNPDVYKYNFSIDSGIF